MINSCNSKNILILIKLLENLKSVAKSTQIDTCKNCSIQFQGEFCIQCGASRQLERISGKYIISEIGKVLNFDKGILFTIKELLIRPDISVKKFIHEDRNRLVKPIIFIIVCSLIYTLAQQIFHFEDGYVNAGGFDENSAKLYIFKWIQSNYGYSNILMAVFIVLWIKILFRKYDYNFFEILVLLLYLMGTGMLIYTCFGIFESATTFKVLHIGGLIGFIYISWAVGRFFDGNKKISFIKVAIAYFLGFLSFFIVALILGFSIDYFLN